MVYPLHQKNATIDWFSNNSIFYRAHWIIKAYNSGSKLTPQNKIYGTFIYLFFFKIIHKWFIYFNLRFLFNLKEWEDVSLDLSIFADNTTKLLESFHYFHLLWYFLSLCLQIENVNYLNNGLNTFGRGEANTMSVE